MSQGETVRLGALGVEPAALERFRHAAGELIETGNWAESRARLAGADRGRQLRRLGARR